MEFTTTCTLQTLRIAHKLDMPDLILASEHYFLEKLTVANCCDFFMDSLSVCNAKDFQSSASGDLVDKCRSFIEENAADVIKTYGFLNLSKEALIQLVSSDKVTNIIKFISYYNLLFMILMHANSVTNPGCYLRSLR